MTVEEMLVIAVAELVVPLGFVDQFLFDYHVGHVLILLAALTILGVVPLRSGKLTSMTIVLFGMIFILTPFWVVPGYDLYMYAGIVMVFVGTMLFVFAEG